MHKRYDRALDEFAYVRSINRQKVPVTLLWPNVGRRKKPIPLAEGVQKLHVSACRGSACAEAVLRLDVGAGLVYQLKAKFGRDKDYTDFWIEVAESEETVAGPLRVLGIN
jgi:hypothetical protein